MMEPNPPNSLSGGDGNNSSGDTANDFEAFSLAPVALDTVQSAEPTNLPSLRSIHQLQMQQQLGGSSMQQSKAEEGLPSPDELSGPMCDVDSGGDGSWPPPPPPPLNPQHPLNPQQTQTFLSKVLTCGGRCSVEVLQPYFDIDTVDVIDRVKGSLRYCLVDGGFRQKVLYCNEAVQLACRNSENDSAGIVAAAAAPPTPSSLAKGPDLYGPVWIAMTLAFCVAATSNISLYAHHASHRGSVVGEGGTAAEEEWDYDINQLLRATWILYSFALGVPTALCFAISLAGGGGSCSGLGLVDLVCLYGYSLVPYLPATWLGAVPFGWAKWIVLLVATAVSGMLVLKNVAGPIAESVGAVEGTGIAAMMQRKSAGLSTLR